MRKHLSLVLVLLLIPSLVFADSVIVAKKKAASGDSCTGSLLFSWHAETTTVTTGTPAGCSVGDTTGSPVSGVSIDTDGSPTAKDGSGTISVPTAGDYYSFTWSNDIVSPTEGRVDMWVYWTTLTSSSELFSLVVDGSNYIRMNLDATNKYVAITHTAGGTSSTGRTAVSAVDVNDWYHVVCHWSSTDKEAGNLHVKCCADKTNGTTNCGDTGTNPLGTWSGTTGSMYIGDKPGWGGVFFIDLIKIYNTWSDS